MDQIILPKKRKYNNKLINLLRNQMSLITSILILIPILLSKKKEKSLMMTKTLSASN
jgi:hypothetical protein